MKLIINADDYGINISTTKAILEAFAKGLCSSTTIMATGDAFEEAVELAITNHIVDKIGLHINLTEGIPVSQPIRKLEKFCNEEGLFNGIFRAKRSVNLAGFSREEKEAVSLEIRAQVEKCLKSGLVVSHIDSHHHVHTRWEVWKAIEPVIRDFNINKVRISRNCGENILMVKRMYKYLFNNQLRLVGFKTANYFGNIADGMHLLSNDPQLIAREVVIEIMVHPKYNNAAELVDSNNTKLEEAAKAIPGCNAATCYTDSAPNPYM